MCREPTNSGESHTVARGKVETVKSVGCWRNKKEGGGYLLVIPVPVWLIKTSMRGGKVKKFDATYRGWPADTHFIALVRSEIIEEEPCCGPVGLVCRRELSREPGPEGVVGRGEGMQVEIREDRVRERNTDGFRAEEDGLLRVGEGGSEEADGDGHRHQGSPHRGQSTEAGLRGSKIRGSLLCVG